MTDNSETQRGRMIHIEPVPLEEEDRAMAAQIHRQLRRQFARFPADGRWSTIEDRDAPSERCHSYNTGHRVHWIQARQAWKDQRPGHLKVAVELLSVSEHGWLELLVDGTDVVRRWTHDAHRAEQLLQRRRPGHAVTGEVNLHWSYLDLTGDRPYSITETPRSCVFEAPTGDLLRDASTHNGFSVTGQHAIEYLDRRAQDGQQ